MRYTLRLLTLDQLGRAATMICALELLRRDRVDLLGDWPFEIGLWVGRAATPNRMGRKGDGDDNSARAKVSRFCNDERKASPIPLETCPWCGGQFTGRSFHLLPNANEPIDLRINCANRDCAFSGGNYRQDRTAGIRSSRARCPRPRRPRGGTSGSRRRAAA